jgi:hypothetical protein
MGWFADRLWNILAAHAPVSLAVLLIQDPFMRMLWVLTFTLPAYLYMFAALYREICGKRESLSVFFTLRLWT